MATRSNPPSYVGQPTALPGKPVVQNFATPNLDDRVYVLRVDSRKPDFALPTQGTTYAGPNAEKYRDFVFATAKPVDQLGWYDFFYVNERENQDAYNFEVAYPWTDRDFPQYTRTYVVLRDDVRANEPQADAHDPVHDDLRLIDHKWIRLQDPVLDALFIGIQRVYERLDGPTITSYDLNQAQQVQTIEVQDVETDSLPTPSATTEVWKVDRKTTAKSTVTTATVPDVFPDTRYLLEREDRILPFKFRTRNPMETDSHIEAGTAVVPTLAPHDWSAEEHQTTEFKKFVSRSFRSAALPITLVDYKLDNDQRLVTVTDTWDSGLQTITPTTNLSEASVENMGNDESIQSLSTIDGPFPKGEYGIVVPDLVPEKFRAAIPIETVTLTSTGTAAMQSLSLGELEHIEQQQTDFWKRVTSRGRDAASLPITLVEYKLTQDKQVETIASTYDVGVQTLPGVDELTTEAFVENLGNSTSVLTVGTVPDLFTEARYGIRIPDAIPERFRVAVPTSTTSLLSAGTASPPVLGTGDLSITEEQTNEFVVRTTTEGRAGITLPVSLTSYKYSRDRQIETVIETLDTGLQTITGSATTLEATVDNLGNNTSLKTLGDVPSVFDEAKYGIRIPDAIPERFRVAVPTTTVSLVAAGTASPPTLGTGDLSITEEQEDAFLYRTTTEGRAGTSLPVTLQSYKLTRDQQIETVVETLDTGLQTITGVDETVIEASVDNLGNNTSLLTVGAVPALFDEAKYAIRIPDAIPERFRVAVPVTSTSLRSAGTAAPPTLGTGDLSITEEQETEFILRTTTESRAGTSLPVTLLSEKMTRDKQREIVAEVLDTGVQTLSGVIDELTVEAEVQNLGNNTSLAMAGKVLSLFDEARYATRIPDTVPERFRVAVPVETTSLLSTGTAAPPTLATGDLSITEEQVDVFNMRTTTETRAGVSLPVSLTSYKLTRDKQVETLIETLDTGLQTLAGDIDELTVEAEVQNLGNNTSLQTLGTVGSLFSEAQGKTSRPEVLPERFRASVDTETVEHTFAGTATVPPVLSGNQIDKTETQLDLTKYRRSITSRDTSSIPTLQGQEYDATLDVVLPYEEFIDTAGDNIGDPRKEVTPLGDDLELVKEPDITNIQAAIDAYILSYPGTANLQLPDILKGITAIMESTFGDGSYDESGSAGYSITGTGGASASLGIKGTGQASAAIIPDLVIDIQQVWVNNVSTQNFLFFLPMPVTTASVLAKLTTLLGDPVLGWPQFTPTAHTLVLTGQKLSLQCTASSNWQQGQSIGEDSGSSEFAISAGTGYSQDVGLIVRSVRIPPTIHETITLENYTDPVQVDITADAQAISSSVAQISKTGSVVGSITPTTLAATANETSIPTSGLRLLHVDASPYKYGYAQIRAEVVDFGDLNGSGGGGYTPPPAPPPPVGYVGNLYISFWIRFTQAEIDAASLSGEFIRFFNNFSPLFGMAHNSNNNNWVISVDEGPTSKTFSLEVEANEPYHVQLRLHNNQPGDPIYLTTSVNGVNYPGATVNIGDNLTVNKLYAGTYNTPISRITDRKIAALRVGTHPGNADVFDGAIDTTIVPPFDSRVGAGVSAVNHKMVVIAGAGVDTYAIKEFTDQEF